MEEDHKDMLNLKKNKHRRIFALHNTAGCGSKSCTAEPPSNVVGLLAPLNANLAFVMCV